MLSLREPSEERLAQLVETCRTLELSDPPGRLRRAETWLTANRAAVDQPGGSTMRWRDEGRSWFLDRHTEVVGNGAADFDRACESLRAWAKFRQPWTRPALPLAPIAVGETVGYGARFVGVWWSFCCRIIDVIDETGADESRRFGLDYATVRGHAERGEERFLVTLDAATGDVRFGLFAVSRPGRWYTMIGLPLARAAQRKFRPGAAAAVREWVRNRAVDPADV